MAKLYNISATRIPRPLDRCDCSPHNQLLQGEAMRFMQGLVWLAPLVVLAAGCGNNVTAPTDTKATSPQISAAQSPVERGKYLVTIGGCNDCHTPKKLGAAGPEPDMTR